jgi:hypothetical protein
MRKIDNHVQLVVGNLSRAFPSPADYVFSTTWQSCGENDDREQPQERASHSH